ncbi:MAG: hypothetical protein WDO12_04015 [Pseudomonadota bacterium]
MSRFNVRAGAAWFAATALLGTHMAGANPREAFAPKQVEDGIPAGDPAVWMKRLVGVFRIEGTIHHQEIIDFDQLEDAPPNPDIQGGDGELRGPFLYANEWSQPLGGKGECMGFSEGPGQHCVANIVWPETWRATGKVQLGGIPDLTPAMIMGGLTPSIAGGIRFLLVNDKGLAYPGSLILSGDSATAKPPCVDLPGTQHCDERLRVTAKADGNVLFVQFSVTTRFLRSKMDRKQSLDLVKDSMGNKDRFERSTEWVDELLDVSLSLRRETPATPAQGSR